MASATTLIKASYIIAFDGKQHCYLKDAELAFQDDTIIYVGEKYGEPAENTIDAYGKVLCPGFISTHAHLFESPMDRSFIEDKGNPRFYMSGLYENLPARGMAMDDEMRSVCLKYSLAELLRSGTTTVVELGPACDELAEYISLLGNRVYFGPIYRSARWYTPDGKQVLYEWAEDKGFKAMEQALEFIKAHENTCNGLLKGVIAPSQIDTCTPELLKESHKAAMELGTPLTIHTSQAVVEFNEMLRRHGKTPVAWLNDLGCLDENTLLGHAIIIGGSSWTNYPAGDLEIMAGSGCSVAHAPWVFARRGIVMESFHKYQKAGVNMTLGTDTCPQNMIQAMRWASVLSKIMERNTESTTAADVFNAATLNAARILGRKDLGRLATGAKADIVIFSADSTNMVPMRDPVKNIVYSAEMEDVETVIVNGRTVVEGGRVLGADIRELNRRVQEAGEKLWPRLSNYDWAERSVDELSPPSFPYLNERLENP
ncbi:MAG: amidohydrolase family protein [Deltaproteobacteria bacterium]|nr:amidohydrolase family protein [Deltaproteobacteria bacterium]MBW2150223.1 amidohydrolase family protein [Deltaproteobacteria bacterium]